MSTSEWTSGDCRNAIRFLAEKVMGANTSVSDCGLTELHNLLMLSSVLKSDAVSGRLAYCDAFRGVETPG